MFSFFKWKELKIVFWRKSFSFLSELIVNRVLIVSIVIKNICSIHLTQDDYLNHLQYIIKREYCFLQKTQLPFGILEEFELLQRKFQGINSIKIDHFDQERVGEETLEEVNWHERVLVIGIMLVSPIMWRGPITKSTLSMLLLLSWIQKTYTV